MKLEQLFNFTHADLVANRQRKLSNAQLQAIKSKMFAPKSLLSALVLGGGVFLVFFVILFIALSLRSFWLENLIHPYEFPPEWVLPFTIVPSLLFGTLFFSFNFFYDKEVKNIRGIIRLETIAEMPYLAVGGGEDRFLLLEHDLPKIEALIAANPTKHYIVYHTNDRITAVERIEKHP